MKIKSMRLNKCSIEMIHVEVDDLQKEIDFKMDQETFMSYYSYYSYENMIRNLIYVGSILCIAFLIGIASIIYTRLYSLADEESKNTALWWN